ncbi:MAG: FtsX-like permease family protein [Balneolaceae bacterium]|nr:FtsX-like permease family protein [Balneolaceae bacterium]
MLKNYVKLAVRHLLKTRLFSGINILGLAVGMATCLLILFYVKDELSYDRFHEHPDRIYRVVSDWGDFSIPATSISVVNRLKDDFAGIEKLSWIMQTGGLVESGENSYMEEQIYLVPPAFLDMFHFPLKRGNPESVLDRPFTIVLSSGMARKYFGDRNPVGESLRIDNQFEVEVTGVLEPVPHNTHFDFDFLASWQTMEAAFNYSESMDGQWGSNSIYTYLQLGENTGPETVEKGFPDFVDRHAGDNWNGSELSLQPLTDIHLYSHHNDELAPNSRAVYVYIFSGIALAILLIACINFVNLSTARSAERAREVGVRRALGGYRGQLIGQFLTESVILAVAALVVSLMLVQWVMPLYRELSGKPFTFDILYEPFTVLLLGVVTLVIGVLAGSFPAFVLSRFRPVCVLRGIMPATSSGEWLRKGLVVFQFTVSIILIAGTIIVYNQLEYLRSASLGFDQERVVVVPMLGGDDLHQPQYEAFKQELRSQSGVEQVTAASTGLPSELLDGTGIGFVEAGLQDDSLASLRLVSVSHDFFETMGVEMIAGRSFSTDFATDSSAYILNEAAFRMLASELPSPLNDPSEVIGRQLRGWNNFPPAGELIGISENFNMATLHEKVEPVIFMIRPDWYDNYLVRVEPGDFEGSIATLQRTWDRFFPGWPFDYRFADQAFDARYRAEERLGNIFGIFAVLAIIVACLGLFGLAAFTAEKRTKEIGIRKVMGATVVQVVTLLSRDFMKVVGIAFLCAVPVAWYAMQMWLQDFAYRVEIGPGVFITAGVLALLITLVTVSGQSLKAAFMNPVQSLRSE